MIKTVKGDVTEARDCIIPHGVNCQGKMRSGVAKAIRERWPVVYESFMNIGANPKMLGLTQMVRVEDDTFVINCYTQEYYGYDGQRYASLEAVDSCMKDVFQTAQHFGKKVCMPKIASDRGGLDWETEVKPIIERYSQEYDVLVYVYQF